MIKIGDIVKITSNTNTRSRFKVISQSGDNYCVMPIRGHRVIYVNSSELELSK